MLACINFTDTFLFSFMHSHVSIYISLFVSIFVIVIDPDNSEEILVSNGGDYESFDLDDIVTHLSNAGNTNLNVSITEQCNDANK